MPIKNLKRRSLKDFIPIIKTEIIRIYKEKQKFRLIYYLNFILKLIIRMK
jgi:hypothetical protein